MLCVAVCSFVMCFIIELRVALVEQCSVTVCIASCALACIRLNTTADVGVQFFVALPDAPGLLPARRFVPNSELGRDL